jgi:hypothetical protein
MVGSLVASMRVCMRYGTMFFPHAGGLCVSLLILWRL